MAILDWIKANAKEGANIAEAEELLGKSTFDSIKSKEEAADFISKNSVFKSAFDSMVSTAVNNHDERFKSEKLPDLVKAEREKILKELNPEETPEQKRIRELEENLKARDAKDRESAIKAELRQKAQELGYDPLRAERFSAFGDKALDMLADESTYLSNLIDSKIKEGVKGVLLKDPPKGGRAPEGKLGLDDIEKLPTREERLQALKANGYA